MSILRVARMGHPVLRQIAAPIPAERISSDQVQRLIDDMLDTVAEYDGAGLAAPQVHEPVRLVVLNFEDDEGLQVWINPEIEILTDEITASLEGCLSVPQVRGVVARPAAVHVRALDRHGRQIDLQLHGFPAVVAQHECDHLDGVLFVDRVQPRTLTFLEELRRHGPYPWLDEDEDEDLPTDDDGDVVEEHP